MGVLTKMVSMETIKRRSIKALCGAFEREVVVDADEVSETKRVLRSKGFIIIGTGDAGFGKKKIWYNPAGMNL